MMGTANKCHPQALVGRRRERAVLEQLLRDIRDEKGTRVLVLRGESGIGKTALLEYLVKRVEGLRLARAAGVQSENGPRFCWTSAVVRAATCRTRPPAGTAV
jgi:ABC-type transport system involved in cytochrome c biogenesis ATPase subunit